MSKRSISSRFEIVTKVNFKKRMANIQIKKEDLFKNIKKKIKLSDQEHFQQLCLKLVLRIN